MRALSVLLAAVAAAAAGPGLLVSLEHRHARRDLGPDRTVLTGVAGYRDGARRTLRFR